MRSRSLLSAWVCRGVIIASVAVAALSAQAAETVLFPKPLHLVRRIEDPLAKGAATVHEYCAGNRIVTVSGSRVVVADYDKQELTEIDREAGTYSVTRFEEIARVQQDLQRTPAAGAKSGVNAAAKKETWKTTPLGARSSAGRSVDSFELVHGEKAGRTTIQVGVDRHVTLTRGAVEVLIGAAFPNVRRDEHDALLAASAGTRGGRQAEANAAGGDAAADYGLPVEQVFTFEADGARVDMRNTIVEVTSDLPPADLVVIPPGSRVVESKTVRLARELRELDTLPAQTKP